MRQKVLFITINFLKNACLILGLVTCSNFQFLVKILTKTSALDDVLKVGLEIVACTSVSNNSFLWVSVAGYKFCLTVA